MPIQPYYDDEHTKLTDMEYVRLYAQSGLVGEVLPNLRAVSVDIVNDEVIVYGIFDGPYTDKEADNVECVATEIFAVLGLGSNAIASISRCDYPNPLEKRGEWVYMRYESPRPKSSLRSIREWAERIIRRL